LIARSTMMAVLVNGLTTIAGFGSLMVADHRGIFGLGLLLTLGTVTSIIAALVVLPVLLKWLPGRSPASTPPGEGGERAALTPAGHDIDHAR
jgi:uncharacterized protein